MRVLVACLRFVINVVLRLFWLGWWLWTGICFVLLWAYWLLVLDSYFLGWVRLWVFFVCGLVVICVAFGFFGFGVFGYVVNSVG